MAEEYVVVSDNMDDGEVSLNSKVRNAAAPRKCKALELGRNHRQQAQLPGEEASAPDRTQGGEGAPRSVQR